jgi:hypothetical protein
MGNRMKRCFKCGREKPTEDFYPHPMMADGLLGKCKPCTRRDVRENYERRRGQYLAYERRRAGPARAATACRSAQRYPQHIHARKVV